MFGTNLSAARVVTFRHGVAKMKKFIIILIKCYSYLISPLLGNNCRFYPSCSCYAQTAVGRFGVLKGSWLTIRRISKCHPWHEGGIDLVPSSDHKQPVDTHG